MRMCAVLDLVLSNDPNMVEEVEVGEHLGTRDHNIGSKTRLLRCQVQDKV